MAEKAVIIGSGLYIADIIAQDGIEAIFKPDGPIGARLLAMAGLRDGTVGFTTSSGSPVSTSRFGDFYNETVGLVATATRHAEDEATVQHTLASNADTRRQSVSGVSTDEELIKVIEAQHAYQGAARLVSVVDEMMQTLVDLGR